MTEPLTETQVVLILSIIKFITVALGMIVIYLGAKAFRSTGRKSLGWLTLGMMVMTLGAVSEGLAYQGLGLTLDQSHILEGFVTMMGFGLIVYSLYR